MFYKNNKIIVSLLCYTKSYENKNIGVKELSKL